ncbi:MAG: hypothetical protein ABI624_04115 [Casimicrobiaceae bacterium]
MKNPWLMKNPFLSIWLSGAHRAMGTARGMAMAMSKQQAAAMMSESFRQASRFWMGGPAQPVSRRRKKAR